ncbi:MAG: four helix bundle protein [Vicinamibacterales bacterium]
MATIRSYRDLDAWKRAMTLAVEVYRISERLPRQELFGPTHQMRRAVVSIPSNIAEGHGRLTRQAYVNHLNIALGSLAEVETHLALAIRLEYTNESSTQDVVRYARETGQLVMALVHALEKPQNAA